MERVDDFRGQSQNISPTTLNYSTKLNKLTSNRAARKLAYKVGANQELQYPNGDILSNRPTIHIL